ncbi:MAG TPA: YicC/YloC family endoribonuclease [Terriglobales bacterium]|nr:YicC/YloC family endoribonuclease [Terriglobales bacterium]
MSVPKDSPVYSMTGYAQARHAAAGMTVTVTLKAVNHRHLDARWQVPEEWEAVTAALEPRLRRAVRRGHIDIRIAGERALAGDAAGAVHVDLVDWEQADAYVRTHREVAQRFGLPDLPAVSEIMRFASATTAVNAARRGLGEAPLEAITAAWDEALEALNRMRVSEGERLVEDVLTRCQRVDQARTAIAGERTTLQAALFERLRIRMRELLGDHAGAPERLLQEAALLAERSDISEELTRLEAHIAQVRALLAAGGEVGKRLDFLAQELNREANTLLSKTGAGGEAALRITSQGLELKAEIEKMREQVQNLE